MSSRWAVDWAISTRCPRGAARRALQIDQGLSNDGAHGSVLSHACRLGLAHLLDPAEFADVIGASPSGNWNSSRICRSSFRGGAPDRPGRCGGRYRSSAWLTMMEKASRSLPLMSPRPRRRSPLLPGATLSRPRPPSWFGCAAWSFPVRGRFRPLAGLARHALAQGFVIRPQILYLLLQGSLFLGVGGDQSSARYSTASLLPCFEASIRALRASSGSFATGARGSRCPCGTWTPGLLRRTAGGWRCLH